MDKKVVYGPGGFRDPDSALTKPGWLNSPRCKVAFPELHGSTTRLLMRNEEGPARCSDITVLLKPVFLPILLHKL